MARKRRLAAAVFSIGCLHVSSLMALGLGELKLESFLNEPLKANVDLLNMGGLHEDQIRVRLATSEDFDKLGIDRAYFLTNIKFEVVDNGSGGARLVITSEEPVLEPYLDFIVEARWPTGRLLREYTVLVDPPVFSNATPVVSASQRVEEVEGIPPATAKKKEVVVETSGTRVDIRNSELAPGAMPQRGYNASTASAPTPGSRYMISRDDTLWEIASQAKPGGSTIHQTMLDIQRLNPDAFINGNINRIKAGYIIQLPTAQDISSADVASALAEVNEQNAAWREGRDAELYATSGPSLRISAEPEDEIATETGSEGATATGAEPARADTGSVVGGESTSGLADAGELDALGEQERLAAAEEQLETLKRIVSLKDDQIAALQNALADAGVAPVQVEDVEIATEEMPAEVIEGEEVYGADSGAIDMSGDTGAAEESADGFVSAEESDLTEEGPGDTEQEAVLEVAETVTQMPAETPAVTTPVVAEPKSSANGAGEGLMSYIWYLVGALVLGVLGFIALRRRGNQDEDAGSEALARPAKDDFSDVKLKQKDVEIEAPQEGEAAEEAVPNKRDNRGYGERKHDEYASDVDAADALAEADIYIAYGRHPQAIDLLNNALETEPLNPVYRLKLLEIYTEQKNHDLANVQLQKLQEIGHSDSIAQAEALMAGLESENLGEEPQPGIAPTGKSTAPGLSPNPLSMMEDSESALDPNFSGLEIEASTQSGTDEDELDLSRDFGADTAASGDDEDLVIAADSNGMSTKLDLARAYMDMGDDDGARQILDEVIAEGSDELKTEARSLLDRIG